jgi:nucleoside-diphosphate-sugar epimerase
LAQAVAVCLQHPAAVGRTYFAAGSEAVTARDLAGEIARQMGRWTVPLPLPPLLLWPICFGQEVISRITGRAMLLNLQKYAEIRAPGWVCDSSRLLQETGFACSLSIKAGVAETLAWYRQQGDLAPT